jgi:hypothetical protein
MNTAELTNREAGGVSMPRMRELYAARCMTMDLYPGTDWVLRARTPAVSIRLRSPPLQTMTYAYVKRFQAVVTIRTN